MHGGSQSFTEREETASGQTSLESGWVFAVSGGLETPQS